MNEGHSASAQQPETIRADPVQRRRAIIFVLVATVIGAAAIQWLLPWSKAALEQAVRDGMPKSVICEATLVVLAVVAISVAMFGAYAMRMGRQVLAAGRFPPPGVPVIRDTRVVSGRAARLLGRGQVFLGGSLIFLAAALFILSAYGLFVLIR